LIYDRRLKKILKYDSKGFFLDAKFTPFRADAFSLLDDKRYMFSIAVTGEDNPEKMSKLIITDSLLNVVNSYFNYDKKDKDNNGNGGFFKRSALGIVYNKPVNDSIFVFDRNGKIINSYLLDFGKSSVPHDLRNDYSKVVQKRDVERFSYMYTSPIMLDNFILGNIFTDSKKAIFVYDLKNDRYHIKKIEPSNFSHKHINFPLGAAGDSAVFSYLDHSLLMSDKDKALLDDKVIRHVEKGGVVLSRYILNKN
jgi:hypothetical protein